MSPLQGTLRSLRDWGGRRVAEAMVHREIGRGVGAPRVVFFPRHGRNGSSCGLRAFNIADALREQGWNALAVPGRLDAGQRQRVLARFAPDIVVLQKFRHPLNRPGNFHGLPVVLDLDDADFLDPRRVDMMEQEVRRVAGVICGSRFIQDWASRLNDNTAIVWTGNDPGAGTAPRHAERRPIVSWAVSSALAYPREFEFVTDMVVRLAETSPHPFVYRQYGWTGPDDHPHLERIRAAGVEVELRGPLPYDAFLASLREVAIGLAPLIIDNDFSKGKSFGKVLGYLNAKVPILCSDAADHEVFFRPGTGVVTDDVDVWVETATRWLSDPALRDAVADAAHADYVAKLSVGTAAREVGRFLSRTLERADARAVHA